MQFLYLILILIPSNRGSDILLIYTLFTICVGCATPSEGILTIPIVVVHARKRIADLILFRC